MYGELSKVERAILAYATEDYAFLWHVRYECVREAGVADLEVVKMASTRLLDIGLIAIYFYTDRENDPDLVSDHDRARKYLTESRRWSEPKPDEPAVALLSTMAGDEAYFSQCD